MGRLKAPGHLQGWLKKQGEQGWGWKKRWFVLKDNKLHYYADEFDPHSLKASQTKPLGSIPLQDAVVLPYEKENPAALPLPPSLLSLSSTVSLTSTSSLLLPSAPSPAPAPAPAPAPTSLSASSASLSSPLSSSASSLPYVATNGLGSSAASSPLPAAPFSPSATASGAGRFSSLLPSLSSSLSSLAALGGWDSSRYFIVQLPSSEDDGQHVGRTYWLWAESKQEVEAWIEALRYSQKYYKHKQDDEQHMEQHMELGFSWSSPFGGRGIRPDGRSGHTLACIGKRLFLFGGYSKDKESFLNDLHSLSIESAAWKEIATSGSPPSPRHGHSCTVLENRYLFIFGGIGKTGPLNDLHVFDTVSNEWRQAETVGDIPPPRALHTATLVAGDRLVILGGYGETMPKLTVPGAQSDHGGIYILDIRQSRWSQPSVRVPTMHKIRSPSLATEVRNQEIKLREKLEEDEFTVIEGSRESSAERRSGETTEEAGDVSARQQQLQVAMNQSTNLFDEEDSEIVQRRRSLFEDEDVEEGEDDESGSTTDVEEKAAKKAAKKRGSLFDEEDEEKEKEDEEKDSQHDSEPTKLRSHSAILVDDNKILVFGGYDGKKSSNDLWVLYTTPGKMKWERPLTSGIGPRPTDSHTAVLLGTRMLVIGGWDHRVPSNDLYFLDTNTLVWYKPFASGEAPAPRWSHAVTLSSKNRLYLFGGWNGRSDFDTLHVLTCRHLEDEWQLYFKTVVNNTCAECGVESGTDSIVNLLSGKVLHSQCISQYLHRADAGDWDLVRLHDPHKELTEPRMLLDYITTILKSSTHPLGKNLNGFVDQFTLLYAVESPDVRTLSQTSSQKRLTEETLQKAVKEVKAYVNHICGLILAKFLLLDTPSGREECHVAVNRIILPRVYKPLFNLYVGFNTTREDLFRQQLRLLRRMTPTDFQIKPAFWLKEEGTRANGGSDEDCAELTKPYQMASYFLRHLHHYDTPYDKLDCLTFLRHSINHDVATFWNNKRKQGASNLPKDSDLIITADDLVALFAWLIVHTGVVHLYSELDFISAFMEEGLFTGDGAYSLTTLQVALGMIERLADSPEMVNKFKQEIGYTLDMGWLSAADST